MPPMVSYEHFTSMGLYLHPVYIRILVRKGLFPKPVKGGGINTVLRTGRNAKFFWSKADVENYIKTKTPQQR